MSDNRTPLFQDHPQYQAQYARVPSQSNRLYDPDLVQKYQLYREDKRRKVETEKEKEPSTVVPSTRREEKATTHIVCMNSALRDMNAWPTVSDFEIPLGRTFRNVYSIRVADLQFASSANIISSDNNTISWINAEDIDLGFPTYTATLRDGTYTANTLQSEIANKMNALRRRNGTGALHYFLVKIDLDTSIVSFTSLSNLALGANPITVMQNSNVLTIASMNHGFTTLSTVYFSGVLSLPGIDSGLINGQALAVLSIISEDIFTVEVNGTATATTTGGGTSASVGSPADFKFLWGSTTNTCADVLGFADQDTGTLMGVYNPLTSMTLNIDAVTPGNPSTCITSYNHRLQVGDYIKLIGLSTNPSTTGIDGNGLVVTVTQVDTPDTFYVNFAMISVDPQSISNAFIGTSILTLQYINHGMNQVISVTNGGGNIATVGTVLPHNLATGSVIYLGGTNCSPDLLGAYNVVDTPDDLTFTVDAQAPVTRPGTRGVFNATGRNIISGAVPASNGTSLVTVTTSNEHGLRVGQNVYILFPSAFPTPINGLFEVITVLSGYTFIYDNGISIPYTGPPRSGSLITFAESFLLYNIIPTSNFTTTAINNVFFTIREILDKDFLTFTVSGSYEQRKGGVTFGGKDGIISSDQHGFAGAISNVDASNALIRPVSLCGADFCFLCCPGLGLDSVSDAGSFVHDILAKVLLSGNPGTVLFDQFVPLPNLSSRGLLSSLDTIRFQLRKGDGKFLSTNNLDYSMSLLINYISYVDTGNMVDSQTSISLNNAEKAMAKALASGRVVN